MSHDRLSPSKSERVLLCAASANRESQFPDDDAGPSANEGSNVHWIGEHALRDQQWPPKILGLGMPMVQASAPYPEVDITLENLESAERYYDYVTRRVIALSPATLHIEEQVDPQLYTGRSDSKGSCDAGIASADFLEVIDYKNGGVEVEAGCSQLRLYALGMLAKYADEMGTTPFTTVRLTVFQPKRPGLEAIERSVDFTPDELIAWAAEVWGPAAYASDDPNARATVTTEGCKYCKAQKYGACAEYTAAQQGAAAMLFQPIEGQAVTVADPLASAFSVEDMTPEQVGVFLDAWPLMKARAKDIEEYGFELLKLRTAVPGQKLVKGKGSRSWGLDDEDQVKKFRNMKLKLNQIFEQKLRSPSKMLALDLKTSVKESIKKHIVHKDGALTIVPTTDKRVDAFPAIAFEPVAPATFTDVGSLTDEPSAVMPDFLSL